jgi:hypothetical protein
MTEKQIKHIMETYHRKAMREPAKRLRAAIEQASKKRCWYNGWKHEGDRADYGILYDPMREFLPEAQFSDICAMCDFLLAKANKQIEKSDDDGDCAGQARYWMERMLKALMKCEGSLAEKIGWLKLFSPMVRRRRRKNGLRSILKRVGSRKRRRHACVGLPFHAAI